MIRCTYVSLILVFQCAEIEFQSDSSAIKSNMYHKNVKTEKFPVNKTSRFYITFLMIVWWTTDRRKCFQFVISILTSQIYFTWSLFSFSLRFEGTYYILDVLWGQPIKLIQVASDSELHENQLNDHLFFEIVPSHCFGASEASKIDCFKN